MMRILRVLALVVASAALTASAYQSTQPWPPAVVEIAPISRALAPAEALKSFALPPGFRREWGATAAPVEPAEVGNVRRATADRTRPWTRDELMALY